MLTACGGGGGGDDDGDGDDDGGVRKHTQKASKQASEKDIGLFSTSNRMHSMPFDSKPNIEEGMTQEPRGSI